MSPSTSTPQDAYRLRGTFVCRVCEARDRGGQREFYRHWLLEHGHEPDSHPVETVKVGGERL